MNRSRIRLLAVAGVAALALSPAACGEDGDDGSAGNDGGKGPGDLAAISSGILVGVAGTPTATGLVSIGEDAGGDRYLVLGDDFVQGKGPGDTEVRLAAGDGNIQEQIDANPASVSAAIGIVPNGHSGGRSFLIPADVDLSDYSYAVIWCPTAAVNFGVALLQETDAATWSATLATVAGTPGASGAVTISEAVGGGFVLVLGDDFVQGMGPGDTEVRLADGDGNVQEQIDADATSVSASAGIVPNGFAGRRSYTLPAGVSPSDHGYVIIWCPTAAVNFGVGALAAN